MILPSVLPIELISAGTVIARIHWSGTKEPFFGPGDGKGPTHRFHDPQSDYRVCFLGSDASASFAETFLRNPPIRLVTREELGARELSAVRVLRQLRLAKLHGDGLARMGCTADITSSPPPYREPQLLSRAIWSHPEQPDGILYRCRHDNGLFAIAVFDRSAEALEILDTESLLNDQARLLEWRRRYGFEIA